MSRWCAFVLIAGVGACAQQGNTMRPAGEGAARIAMLNWIFIAVCTGVFLIVTAVTLYAALHRRPPGKKAYADASVEPDTDVEPERDRRSIRWIIIGGAAIPSVILVALFVFTMLTLNALSVNDMRSPLVIEVTGQQWWWEVRYIAEGDADAEIVSANEIHIPTGIRVPIRLISTDVVHSFWVPELQGKLDLVPGRVNVTWIQADRPGIFIGHCAEYCGLQHTRMDLRVVAHEPADFEQWKRREAMPAQPAEPEADEGGAVVALARGTGGQGGAGHEHSQPDAHAPDAAGADTAPAGVSGGGHAAHGHGAAAGREAFITQGCAYCHRIRGTAARGTVGPDLTHVGSRLTLAAGTLENSRGNLAGWIANPQGIKPGARMPRVPLTPDQLNSIVTYLESLR